MFSQCPICGETLPISGKECWHCGHIIADKFDTADSAVRARAAEGTKRKQPSALKPSRHAPVSARTMYYMGGGMALVLILAIAGFMVARSARGNAKTPEQAVRLYYDYLENKKPEELFELFEPGYQPRTSERINIVAAVEANRYDVKDLEVSVVSNDDKAAVLAITSVNVTVTDSSGTSEKSLASMHKAMTIRAVSYGRSWKISGRPNGGWKSDNLWLLGEMSNVTTSFAPVK